MRTSFHHQPEAQHPKSSSYPQAGRPSTPSFGGKADIRRRLLWSTLRLFRRQLVRQLRPLVFDHGPHFIRDVVDVFDFEQVLMEAPQVGRRHDLATDNARRVGALVPHSRAGGAPGLGRRIVQACAAEALLKGFSGGGIGEAEANTELLPLVPATTSAN